MCVTEVKAFQFNAQAVRDLCAADPVISDELIWRLLQMVAGRLQATKARLITRSYGTSPYPSAYVDAA